MKEKERNFWIFRGTVGSQTEEVKEEERTKGKEKMERKNAEKNSVRKAKVRGEMIKKSE